MTLVRSPTALRHVLHPMYLCDRLNVHGVCASAYRKDSRFRAKAWYRFDMSAHFFFSFDYKVQLKLLLLLLLVIELVLQNRD